MTFQLDAYGQQINLIHFVFQTEPERIACMPHMEEFHSTVYHKHYQRTNEPRAVSCPQCRATKLFKERVGG